MATVLLHRGFSSSSILLLLLVVSSSASPVHDMLKKYEFPQGLLPDTAKSYSLSSDGDFVVELDDPCCVQFSVVFRYEKTIRGTIKSGVINKLFGIQLQKDPVIWLPITDVIYETDDNFISFMVGDVEESVPADNFENIPSCMAKEDNDCYSVESSIASHLRGLSNGAHQALPLIASMN